MNRETVLAVVNMFNPSGVSYIMFFVGGLLRIIVCKLVAMLIIVSDLIFYYTRGR